MDCNKISLLLHRLGFALRAKRVMGSRGKTLLFAFLCVSEHFELTETHFFFENFCEREARERSEQGASANMLRQTVTLATAIILFLIKQFTIFIKERKKIL